MEKYDHIKDMEKILNEHEEKLKDLDEVLAYLSNHIDEFRNLVEYYHSEERENDLKDESDGKIPKDIKRGVLSEDAIYNLIFSYHNAAIRMLDLVTCFFKIY